MEIKAKKGCSFDQIYLSFSTQLTSLHNFNQSTTIHSALLLFQNPMWNLVANVVASLSFVNRAVIVISETCPLLRLRNGQVAYNQTALEDRYPVQTSASFTCDVNYILVGTTSTICQSSGSWTKDRPRCQGNNSNSTW